MLYLFDRVNDLKEDDLKVMLPALSKERAENVAAKKFLKDKILSAAAYILLFTALAPERGRHDKVSCEPVGEKLVMVDVSSIRLTAKKRSFLQDKEPFVYNEYKKPDFKDGCHFNLSHTDGAVLCSLSANVVGCDIEKISDRIICPGYIFHKNEIEPIEDKKDPEIFTRLWTAKEAFGKCLGTGLLKDLSGADLSKCIEKERFTISYKGREYELISIREEEYFIAECKAVIN